MIRRGIELRQQGDDAGALLLFQQAWQLDPSPRAVGQMGLCEYALSRWVDAEQHLREALTALSDPWVTRSRAALEESYARVRQQVANVNILGPDGARVWVDRREYTLPLAEPVRTEPGDVAIRIEAPGFETYASQVSVSGGQLREIDVRPQLLARVRLVDEPPAAPRGILEEPVFWVVVGGVVLLGAGAVVFATTYDPGVEPAPPSSITVQALRF